ncbi:MAG: 30S ribosomal protein S5 [Phycisphaerae bacterium]
MSRGHHPQVNALEGTGLEDTVVRIYRCATVVKGGRRFSFSALVVVGDRQGRVGIGYGKAREVPAAVEKGRKIASKSLREIKLQGATLPHRVVGRFGASQVVMVPASPGTGVIAGASVRAVLELAGVHDVLTKSYGSRNPKNLVRATYDALVGLHAPSAIEQLRDVKLAG